MSKQTDTPQSKPPPTLQELHLRRQLRLMKRRLKQQEAALLEQDDRLASLIEEIPALAPLGKITHHTSGGSGKKSVVAVGVLGDWHYGDKVEADEIQGYNAFNADIADQRLDYWTTKFLAFIEVQRKAYTIEECVLLGVGDFIHGMIHLENLIYGEFEPTVAVVRAAAAWVRIARRCAAVFKTVRLELLDTDNHSRMTQKTLFKGRAKWSLGYLLNEMVRQQLVNCPNVQVITHHTIKADVEIGGRTLLMEHGNDVRGWMGVPYYGIDRLKMREAQRRSMAGLPKFDFLVMGHWHTYAMWPGVIMNGSLCGTTPYDHAASRYSPPSQLGFLMHPRHGVFAMTSFDLRSV